MMVVFKMTSKKGKVLKSMNLEMSTQETFIWIKNMDMEWWNGRPKSMKVIGKMASLMDKAR